MTPKQKIQLETFLDLLVQAQKLTKDVGMNAIPYHEESWAEDVSIAQGNLSNAVLKLRRVLGVKK